MADLTKASVLNFDADSLMRCRILGQGELFAGEALSEMDAVYIASDGDVFKAVTTQTTISGVADFDGLAYKDYAIGDPVTIVGLNGVAEYSASMTPGAFVWVSDTAGKLADAKVLTYDEPVAKSIDATRILVIK